MSLKEIQEFTERLPNSVKDNLQIVSKEQLGQDFFLHISPDNMSRKVYTPKIGERQNKSEDRTVPRITVSDYLYGCMVGYSKLLMDTLDYYPGNTIYKNYKNGLYIHSLDFDYCVKPNNKLVFDSDRSNEHWLVAYNKDTNEVKAKTIGKMFISKVSIEPRTNNYAKFEYELLIEINTDLKIKFSKDITIDKGYWLFEIKASAKDSFEDKNKTILNYRSISQSEYLSKKGYNAALLSHKDMPLIVKW